MASILVVEDPILDSTVTRFLEGAGHVITLAGSVAEARKGLDERPFQLMLSVVESRGRSLEGFLEDAATQRPTMAIVLVCSETNAHAGEDLRRRGHVAEVLRQPVTLVQVRDAAQRALEGRDLLTPIASLRRGMRRLQATELSDGSREILKGMARQLETLASRARSVTGGR